jgi:hypothetical protein
MYTPSLATLSLTILSLTFLLSPAAAQSTAETCPYKGYYCGSFEGHPFTVSSPLLFPISPYKVRRADVVKYHCDTLLPSIQCDDALGCADPGCAEWLHS